MAVTSELIAEGDEGLHVSSAADHLDDDIKARMWDL
jgi:hypothetical protein